MKIAFTAPMKPLDDPTPSGDRTMGRLIVQALRHGGHEVRIASRFRSWRKHGADLPQAKNAALEEAKRVAEDWKHEGYVPDTFLTYHLYHKAPDWVGLTLANTFDLPYALVEASRAPKRSRGEWAFGFSAADDCLERADVVAALHRADAGCLSPVLPKGHLRILLPFIDEAPFLRAAPETSETNGRHEGPLRLFCVGMMREGDKEASYRLLAEALKRLLHLNWHLTVAGDGPAGERIRALFPPARTTFLGAVPAKDMAGLYKGQDILVWPAIREAFGLAFLEAQAAGLAIVGGATFGVPDIVIDTVTGLLSPEGDVEGFAANLARLLEDPALVRRMGAAARHHIETQHSLAAGSRRLDKLLETALANHAARPEVSSGASHSNRSD